PGPAFFPDSTELNFRTSGNWILKRNHQLILNSFSKADTSFSEMARDSVTRNTDLTSFSFWDQYGDPVPIRLIHFPANRIKLHRSNSISFFAQDFKETDTIEFHFYGYMPYRWLARTGEAMTNQQHLITLFEQYRHGYFRDVNLVATRNKLSSPDKSFSIYKSK
ncbi:MAG TPA: hypothetical protein VFO70_00820, partial [Chitinophagaceae bacterium]|nr:hypothetical protein [Chitinophagaceae bacterium]